MGQDAAPVELRAQQRQRMALQRAADRAMILGCMPAPAHRRRRASAVARERRDADIPSDWAVVTSRLMPRLPRTA
jgi:hypothetical protein